MNKLEAVSIDTDVIQLSKNTAAALAGLEGYERHFVIQKVCESIAFSLSFELRQWYEQELARPGCDMAKVARRAEACRLLAAITEGD